MNLSIEKIHLNKPDTDDIGKQISYYRKLKGLTQSELAEEIGVTKSCINSYKNRPIKLVNKKLLKTIFEFLEIEDKVKLPQYEEFILNNQEKGLQMILEKNNLNSFQLARIIGANDCNVRNRLKERLKKF